MGRLMKNPLIRLVCVLVLGVGAFVVWWGTAPDDEVEALAGPGNMEAIEPERNPADLAKPLVDQVEQDSPAEPEAVETEPVSLAEREAIAAHDPVKITGRVVDVATGEGVADCWISLVSGFRAEAWKSIVPFGLDKEGDLGVLIQVQTDAEGRFAVEVPHGELKGEASVFLAAADGWAEIESPVELLPQEVLFGADLQLEVKAWPPPSAGNITGWLRTERGSFLEGTVPRKDHILLDLVSTELPAIEIRATLEPQTDDQGGVTFSFLFEDVPEGNYQLTLSSLSNYRWAPTSLRVAPPASGLEFLRFDLDDVVPLVFEVFDATSREPITDFEVRHIKQTNSAEHGVLLHTGPLELDQFPRDEAFVWSLEADGYAVAYGDEGAFTEVDGKRIARVALKPGWSTRFLVMGGPEGTRPQPVESADVSVDGVLLGRTDQNGTLDVVLETEPELVNIDYPEWNISMSLTPERRRSNVTPVILLEPKRD